MKEPTCRDENPDREVTEMIGNQYRVEHNNNVTGVAKPMIV